MPGSIEVLTWLVEASITVRRGCFWSAVKTHRPSAETAMRCVGRGTEIVVISFLAFMSSTETVPDATLAV